MGFEAAAPVEVKAPGTGFSMALQYTKRSQRVGITITEAAQMEHFGKTIADQPLDVMIGRDGDAGRIKIVLAEQGRFVAKKSAKGSVFVSIAKWNLLPADKRPAQSMQVAFSDSTGLVLMVPDYKRIPPAESSAAKPQKQANGLPKFPPAARME